MCQYLIPNSANQKSRLSLKQNSDHSYRDCTWSACQLVEGNVVVRIDPPVSAPRGRCEALPFAVAQYQSPIIITRLQLPHTNRREHRQERQLCDPPLATLHVQYLLYGAAI